MLEQAIGGFVAGGVYAALAVCLVLMYRMLAVLNFAQASIGALGACAALWAYDRQWSVGASVGLGVLAGAALGAVLGLVMVRWFLDASIEVRSAVTIGFFVTADAVGNRILGGSAHTFPDLFGARTLKIADTGVPVGSLVECGGAILVALAIGVFLRRTRTGTLLRALSSRPTTAELLGVRVGILSVGVWTFAAAVSTLAILFVLPTSTSNFTYLSLLVVPAMAAALMGLLRSFTAAALGGIVVGIVESLGLSSSAFSQYTEVLPFFFIVALMIWWKRKDVWAETR